MHDGIVHLDNDRRWKRVTMKSFGPEIAIIGVVHPQLSAVGIGLAPAFSSQRLAKALEWSRGSSPGG